MATEALESLILDALLVRAQAIAGGPTYNTNPAVKAIGLPIQAIPEGPGEAIYLQHVRTALQRRPTGPSHDYDATFVAWCIGDTDREVLNIKDDLLRAVMAGEAALRTAGATHGFVEGDCFIPDPETLVRIGKAVRIQEFTASYQLTHS